jgi:hypothetical protein
MTLERIVYLVTEPLASLLVGLAWPFVTFVVALLYRAQITSALQRLRRVQGPGGTTAELEPRGTLEERFEEILKSAQQRGLPQEKIEERTARIFEFGDSRKLRIIRAVLGESDGRAIISYRNDYYRPALESLVQSGYLELTLKNKYRLTQKGNRFASYYLPHLLSEITPS